MREKLLVALLVTCFTLTGCAGPSLRGEARPQAAARPLAEAKDARVHVSVENIIVRNGDGSWAYDAEWDEYLIRVRTLSDAPVEVREVLLFDAVDHRVEARSDRASLAEGTREIERRYEDSGRLVRLRGGNAWVAAGAGSVGLAGIAAASAPGGFAGM